jgi:glycosyltransferase involved in cell wall biosynthesis
MSAVCETTSIERFPNRTHPLRVVHVVLSLEVGGLERIVLDLISAGQARGQQVSVLCLERRGILAKDAESLGAYVACVDKESGLKLRLGRRIEPILNKLNPDVVHCHQVAATFYAGPPARRAGVPVIVHTEHNNHYSRRFRTRILGRIACRFVDRFFCVSENIQDEVLRYKIAKPNKVQVVTNGIRLDHFEAANDLNLKKELGLQQGDLVIGTVARLCEQKRQDILINAFAKVHASRPNGRLLIVGDGHLKSELQQLVNRLKIGPYVHFAGYQPEPWRYLSVMDVFALSSAYEGMPLSILEAWACGLPVIASGVGGLPEMINGTDAGVLFPSGDIDALATKLIEFIDNETMRKEFGQRGRKIVHQSYSVERMADRYHEHYLQLLGTRHN